jgi:hypothetical protein
MVEQIDKTPWLLGKDAVYKRYLKKAQRRKDRREGRQLGDDAPPKRAYTGYEY